MTGRFPHAPSGTAVITVLLLVIGLTAGETVATRIDRPATAVPVSEAGTPYAAPPADARVAPHARPSAPSKPAASKPDRVRKPEPASTATIKVREPAPPTSKQAKHQRRPHPLNVARGLGAWIDLYDYGANGPAAAAALADRAADHGVATVWIQTSRYNTKDIEHRAALGAMLDRVHARGMRAIAWVLPRFKKVANDLRQARAAASFRSPGGHRFAALALDIEHSSGEPPQRSANLLALAKKLHHRVGMPLIGIVPPPQGFARNPTYWPGFPWKSLAARVDGLATMGYWSYRNQAPGPYTANALKRTRELVGRSSYPVHVIGGLAAETSVRGVRRFCRAAKRHSAVGASLYDLTSTPRKLWAPLQACRSVGR